MIHTAIKQNLSQIAMVILVAAILSVGACYLSSGSNELSATELGELVGGKLDYKGLACGFGGGLATGLGIGALVPGPHSLALGVGSVLLAGAVSIACI